MCGVRAEEEVSNLTVVSWSWAGICRGEQTVINQRLTVAQTLAGWECVSAYVSVRLGPVSLSACEVCVCVCVCRCHTERNVFKRRCRKLNLEKKTQRRRLPGCPEARSIMHLPHQADENTSICGHSPRCSCGKAYRRRLLICFCVSATPSQSFFFLAGSAWSSFKRSELAELFNNMAVRGIVMST